MRQIFTLLLILYTSGSFAQRYSYYLDSTTTWTETSRYSFMFMSGQEDYKYIIKGDTVINSIMYYKLFKVGVLTEVNNFTSPPVITTTNINRYFAALREDSLKRFFVVHAGQTTESFLFSFNLSVGSQIQTSNCSNMTVIKIDTLYIGSQIRNKFYTNEFALIEGVGPETGLFGYLCWMHHNSSELRCFSKNGKYLSLPDCGAIKAIKSKQDTKCFGFCDGEAKVIGDKGQAPYSYLWDDGSTDSTRTNLCASAYSVTVTDVMGNSVFTNLRIKEPEKIFIKLTEGPHDCSTQSVEVAAKAYFGNWGFSYFWSNGETSDTAHIPTKIFSLTVTDSVGCSETIQDTVSLTFPKPKFTYTSSGLNVSFADSSFNCTKRLWEFGDSTKDSTSINPTHLYAAPGKYQVCLTVSDTNCIAVYCDSVIIPSVITSVSINFKESDILISPNPFSLQAVISYSLPPSAKKASCNIYDIQGRFITFFDLPVNHNSIGVTSEALGNGVYLIDMVVDGINTPKKKIVVLR